MLADRIHQHFASCHFDVHAWAFMTLLDTTIISFSRFSASRPAWTIYLAGLPCASAPEPIVFDYHDYLYESKWPLENALRPCSRFSSTFIKYDAIFSWFLGDADKLQLFAAGRQINTKEWSDSEIYLYVDQNDFFLDYYQYSANDFAAVVTYFLIFVAYKLSLGFLISRYIFRRRILFRTGELTILDATTENHDDLLTLIISQ